MTRSRQVGVAAEVTSAATAPRNFWFGFAFHVVLRVPQQSLVQKEPQRVVLFLQTGSDERQTRVILVTIAASVKLAILRAFIVHKRVGTVAEMKQRSMYRLLFHFHLLEEVLPLTFFDAIVNIDRWCNHSLRMLLLHLVFLGGTFT